MFKFEVHAINIEHVHMHLFGFVHEFPGHFHQENWSQKLGLQNLKSRIIQTRLLILHGSTDGLEMLGMHQLMHLYHRDSELSNNKYHRHLFL